MSETSQIVSISCGKSLVFVIALVLRFGVHLISPDAGRPLPSVVQSHLPSAIRADGKHRNHPLQVQSATLRAGRGSRIGRQQEEFELMAAAAAFVFVDGHGVTYNSQTFGFHDSAHFVFRLLKADANVLYEGL